MGLRLHPTPADYRVWSIDDDPTRPDETVLLLVDDAIGACRSRELHTSLSLHRAPGYVITGWESEPYNLWSDESAQDAFVVTWERFAERCSDIPSEMLSFDLVNEPPALGLRGFTRAAHEVVIRRTVAAIRAISPHRPITGDGLDGGNLAKPELVDLALTQSGRGYQPMRVSHYGAEWWPSHADLAAPSYPCEYDGIWWNRDALRSFFRPWRDIESAGRARAHR